MQEGHDLQKLEHALKECSHNLRQLGEHSTPTVEELLVIVRRPGWTTPAEFALVHALADAVRGQARSLLSTIEGLVAGTQLVGRG